MIVTDERVLMELEHVEDVMGRCIRMMNNGEDRKHIWDDALLCMAKAQLLIGTAVLLERTHRV